MRHAQCRQCGQCHGPGVHMGKQLASVPTTTLPGTFEKIAVMTQRCAAGMSLHHPGDRRIAELEDIPPAPLKRRGRKRRVKLFRG